MLALRAIDNFTVIDSVYGPLVINRHCAYQADALIKTGIPHIQGELNVMLKLINTLSEGAVVVDAGANAGLVSVPVALALAGRRGTVHAFEVQRMMYYALCGSAALNGLGNLHVHHAALGAQPGMLSITPPDYSKAQDFGMFSLVGETAPAATSSVAEQVPVTTIDAQNLSRLDFLKVDVEGMEIDVLKGAAATIAAHRPWCWIEYWKVDMADIKRQFDGLGYRFYVMDKLNVLAAPDARVTDKIKFEAQEV